MRAAVVQLNSQDDVGHNFARVRHWVAQAAAAGAELVALPENFAFIGEDAGKREIAEAVHRTGGAYGPIVTLLLEAAAKHGVWVLGGGLPERSADPSRPFNSSVLVSPEGAVVAVYRKVHLYDVSLSDGTSFRESAATTPGDEIVTADVLGARVGLSVCYDVRFPELYRQLVNAGARVVTVPSAFTVTTGKDHWHVLLRARAIENQVYVLAPAQHGKHPRGRQTYGKSLIADPWGGVIAQCSEGEGFAVASLDFDYLEQVRASLPALGHRKWR